MKKLLFIDNDLEQRTKEDISTAKRVLKYYGGLTDKYVNSMESLSNFSHVDKDEAYKIIFESGAAIVTWSMYTFTHYNSLGQLLHFLKTAGVSQVKDVVYLDTSGNLPRDLGRALRDCKEPLSIINAIEANYIISFKDDGEKELDVFRVRMEFKGLYGSPFKKEKVDLKKILGITKTK